MVLWTRENNLDFLVRQTNKHSLNNYWVPGTSWGALKNTRMNNSLLPEAQILFVKRDKEIMFYHVNEVSTKYRSRKVLWQCKRKCNSLEQKRSIKLPFVSIHHGAPVDKGCWLTEGFTLSQFWWISIQLWWKKKIQKWIWPKACFAL